jgi:type IV pilus assembly protein PilM
MFNFTVRKSVTALDIGQGSVKVVELGLSAGRPVVQKAGLEELALLSGPDQENPEAREQRYASALIRLLKRLNLSPQKLISPVSSIPGEKVSIKQIKSMPLAADELASSLSFEARKHVPVDGEVLMDYQVVQETAEELDILLCVTAKESVKSHLSLLSRAGIRGPVIDAPALAVVNAWLLHPETDLTPETVLFIHVGASLTHLCIYRKKGLFFVREIPVAGSHFTKEIAEKFSVSLPDAERMKRQKGALVLPENGGEAGENGSDKLGFADAETVRHASLEGLMREIHRSIRFYAKETGRPQIDLCVLSGGGVCDASLARHLEAGLRLPCQPLDPFRGLNSKCELPAHGREQYTQVMGMALRGMHELLQNQPQ